MRNPEKVFQLTYFVSLNRSEQMKKNKRKFSSTFKNLDFSQFYKLNYRYFENDWFDFLFSKFAECAASKIGPNFDFITYEFLPLYNTWRFLCHVHTTPCRWFVQITHLWNLPPITCQNFVENRNHQLIDTNKKHEKGKHNSIIQRL